ncbi:MAG: PLP-dependent aminotransferase family protein, partial [Spirochaetia bacterium]|nr:PLP-dependent aminotransferase family protein [Spirochaetia bacterium]
IRNIFMENPNYYGVKDIFQYFKANINFIPVDEKGMRTDMIPAIKNGIVYATPSRQFPLGYTMSIDRRLDLLSKAKKQNLIILEDDFDSDYRYNGEPISSLQGYDTDERVIYTGTFSKVLYSGIRLGYCILPEKFLSEFQKLRSTVNQPPSSLTRSIIADFMRSGKFHKHIRKMHRIYKERKDFMEKEIARELGDILDLQLCSSGLHMHAYFKNEVSRENLKASFKKHKIEIFLLSDYFTGRPEREALIFGFAAFDEGRSRHAVKILKKALQESF